jgi:hypothetical protein
MTKKVLEAALIAIVVVLGFVAVRVPMEAQQPPDGQSALTGTVRSAKEGLMEGVLVSAKRNGSTITTTVVTNAQGVYSFPRRAWSRVNTTSPFVRWATSWMRQLQRFLRR